MSQDWIAQLSITCDFGDPHGEVTGKFQFDSVEIEEQGRTGIIGAGGEIIGLLIGLLEDGETTRKDLSVDLGDGQHVLALNFSLAVGDAGADMQWGRTDDPSVLDETSATGGTAPQMKAVFFNYWRTATIDSNNPAILETEPYSSSGILDPLDVYLEEPSFVDPLDRASELEGTITCVETVDIQQALDALKQTEA
jgi:hypothetical protein